MDCKPPIVVCLFTGGIYLKREWNGCNLAFACDNGFRGNPDSRFFGDCDRVSWKSVAPVDLLGACQPRCPSLHACWMDAFCPFRPVPRIVLFHHKDEWSSSGKIGFTTKFATLLLQGHIQISPTTLGFCALTIKHNLFFFS